MQSTKFISNAGRTLGWLLLFVVLACWLGPSRQSLWIDEAHTASYASETTLIQLGHRLWSEFHSEGLMPLGMLQAWVWAKWLGTSEIALRLPNLVYALIGLLAFIRMARVTRLEWLPLWYLVHPFLWYYVDEARPYCLQIGAAAWFLAAVVEIAESERWTSQTHWMLIGSGLVLAATSLLGFVQVGAAAAALAVIQRRRSWPFYSGFARDLTCAHIPWLILGAYYAVIVLGNGGGGSRGWGFTWQSWAFVVYELLGFAGLGPGRETLREAALQGSSTTVLLLTHSLPLLIALGGALLAPCLAQLVGPKIHDREAPGTARFLLPLVSLMMIPAVALFAICAAAGFTVWARHLAPVFPPVVLLFAWYFGANGKKKSRIREVSGAVALALLFASSVLIRSSPEHAKADYRSAAAWSKGLISRGIRVGWAADDYAARYYGLAVEPECSFGPLATAAYVGAANTPESLSVLEAFVLYRPEIYDRSQLVRHRIEAAGFQRGPDFQGFQTFQLPPGNRDQPPPPRDKNLLPRTN